MENVIKKAKDIVQKSHNNEVSVDDEILSASSTSHITDLNVLGDSESFFLQNGDRSFDQETKKVVKKRGKVSTFFGWCRSIFFSGRRK